MKKIDKNIQASYQRYINSLRKILGEIEALILTKNDRNIFRKFSHLYEFADLHNDREILKILSSLNISETFTKEMHQKLDFFLKKINSSIKDKQHEENFYKNLNNTMIYILDDNIEFAMYLKAQLTTFDYQVRIFNHAKQIIPLIKQKIQNLALVINIDSSTKELEHSLMQLKKNPKFNNIAIFFTSTNGEIISRLKGIRLHGTGFLIKPFLTEELVTKLENTFHPDTDAYRILIVDDDLFVAGTYAKILKKANMQVRIVSHYTQVLNALSELNPDLILMDLYMPYCSGIELAAIIRQQSTYDSVPIIFLSVEESTYKQLSAMSYGGDEFLTKLIKPAHLIATVKNKIARYKILRSRMFIDGLTGVYNHTHILQELNRSIKLSDRTNTPLSIAMLDLDNFKNVNDRYGHQAGDYVLRNFCLLLRRRLRSTDIIGRYGGEEFLIIFPNTNYKFAKKVINILKEQFHDFAHTWNKQIFYLSFSAGIATYASDISATELIKTADSGLYFAKKQGKNRVKIMT